MPNTELDKDKRNKINFTLPSNNSKNNTAELSDKDIQLKDQLMKLIIDTKDEAIELKINGEQYRKIGIHDEWRQVDFNANKAAYFSYQEKAAKDFIFRFNKCGILSDQVGMGKTIEAGMIISELAYRKELGSLLILVPNENMAEKWEFELARKFGFRNLYKNLHFLNGKEEREVSSNELPKVFSIKTIADLYSIIYTAYDSLNKSSNTFDNKIVKCASELFDEICDQSRIQKIRNKITELLNVHSQINSKEFKMEILKNIYAPLIKDFVCQISKKLKINKEYNALKYEVDLSGIYYHIVDMYLDMPITNGSLANGIFERLVDKELITNSIVGEFGFIKSQRGEEIIQKINRDSKKASSNEDRLKYIKDFREIAKKIRQQYAILIVSKTVNSEDDKQLNLLNYCLNQDYESESSRHCSVSTIVEKGYHVIDMLIDMSYKTLIVDEAHDYIKVSHKKRMSEIVAAEKNYEKRQKEGIEFTDLDLSGGNTSSLKYYVFPLYNDYYFVNKDCQYLKVKALAERSYRKIFMTATPIKSDMIDFYLLYLLADNSDTNVSSIIRSLVTEDKVAQIAGLLMDIMSNAQKRAMNYTTHEELVIKYIYQYYKNNQENLSGTFDNKIGNIIDKIIEEKNPDAATVNEICVNRVRLQFQQTFTIKDEVSNEDVEINSIAKLVSSEEGIEQWQNMYSQIGIRSTRHQTFKLDDEHLKMIKPVQREKYMNLPMWSRRNGTIVYIHKKDNFFDLVVKKRLDKKKEDREQIINKNDELRNEAIDIPKEKDIYVYKRELETAINEINDEDYTDKLKESKIKEATKKYKHQLEKLEIKYAPKETAMAIYQYINNQLTGELSLADYYSTDVDYDDFKLHMVVKLMTDGLEIQNAGQPKKINGKVLLFADESTQKKLLTWLKTEADYTNKTMSKGELASYIARYKHQPLWYFNSVKDSDEEKWVITTDIKALKEKKGNYLIVVEPNKYEEGVDLQASNILINFDIKFCPLKMEQRIGRIDRVKLGEAQSQLDIISFTPLNDMSGFMVDFLANELKMFSCWKGDTTGIVSMPLGVQPNSATFESAILAINDAYKNLYKYEGSKFVSSCKRIGELGSNFSNDNFEAVNNLAKKENQILEDFKYLKDSNPYINKIIFNTDCTNETGDEGIVIFDELCVIAKNRAYKKGEISKESISNHKNDLGILKTAIEDYYAYHLDDISEQKKSIEKTYASSGNAEKIENSFNSAEKDAYERLQNLHAEFTVELDGYRESKLAALPLGSLGIKKESLDEAINPILERYKSIINKYLDVLLNLFDRFCNDVTDKAMKMEKFISYLTIEEFKVMADNYE